MNITLGEESPRVSPKPAYQLGQDTNEINVAKIVHGLNDAFKDTDLRVINIEKLRNVKYAADTLNEIINFLSTHIFRAAKENKDLVEIIEQLKSKYATASSRNEKVQILSVLPKSWTHSQIQKEFHASYHLAYTTKKLVDENGILCTTKKS